MARRAAAFAGLALLLLATRMEANAGAPSPSVALGRPRRHVPCVAHALGILSLSALCCRLPGVFAAGGMLSDCAELTSRCCACVRACGRAGGRVGVHANVQP